MSEISSVIVALLGGGTVGVGLTAYFNHKGKSEDTRLQKDELAFNVLAGRLDRLQEEVNLLKAELKIKDELVDKLKDENLRLKYENADLKDEMEKMKGGK